jgi:hypothetical protein
LGWSVSSAVDWLLVVVGPVPRQGGFSFLAMGLAVKTFL